MSELFRAWEGLPGGPLDGDATVVRHQAANGGYEQSLTAAFTEIRRVLRPGGHLILSYANRQPQAWISLFGALQRAGFPAVGFEVLSAENEPDHAKTDKRACNLDVILDLVEKSDRRRRRHLPSGEPTSDEERYCRTVGRFALEVGKLVGCWRENVREHLTATAFLSSPSLAASSG